MGEKDSLLKYTELFVETVIQFGKFTDQGNYKEANRAFDKQMGYWRKMKRFGGAASVELLRLLEHENAHVKLAAAALSLKSYPKEAILTLTALSQDPGIMGLNAKTTLDEYLRGTLKLE